MWYTSGISSNRSGDLDRWPFHLETHAHYCSWHAQKPILLFLGLSVLDLWANTWQTDHARDLVTITFDFGGHGYTHGTSRDAPLHASTSTPSFKFIGLSVQKIWRTFTLSLVILTFDLENWVHYCPNARAVGTFLPTLVFLGRFFLNLSANTTWPRHHDLWPWRS